MIRRKSILLFFAFILLAGIQVSVPWASTGSEITGIEVREVDGSTEISINSTSPLNYTVYKPSDPYLVVVELQDVSLGKFTEKMVIDRAGVTEITPSKVEGMEDVVRLKIVLSVPADVKPVQKDNILLLSFVNPEEGVSMAEAEVKSAERIESIDFSRTEDSLLVTIKGDGMMVPEVTQPQEDKIVIDIPDVITSVEAPKVYEPPMGGMRIGTYPDKTRIVFDLLEPVEYDVSSQDDQIVVSFRTPSTSSYTEAEEVSAPATTSSNCGDIAASKEYEGEKISIDFQDAELIHIFRLLADISGCNIVVSPAVLKKKEKFTMRLKDVPWDQTLDVILRNYRLSKRVEGNIIRIAPTKDVAKEEQEIANRKEAELLAGDLITKSYQLNYANVKDVKKIIEDISKRKGGGARRTSISVDKRTNTLLIRDVAGMHEEYARVIKELDKPIPQVLIDARIVEVSANFTRELGIQWGADVRLNPNMMVGGIENLIGGTGFSSGNPLLVNLPAPATGAIGFGYIGAGALRALDLQLSAMESSGKGKIVSNPKIVTTDNETATIEQGKKIPYQTVSAEGTQTQFVSATLELTVTPHITPGGAILMDVKTRKNEADFANTVAGVPSIDTKEAETKVLINNGDTLVIGGIFKTNESISEANVPLLGKIPILGWFFKSKKKVKDTTELLIFITPKIIEQPSDVMKGKEL
jgi:type IV pilus assembly protein PilQ